MPFGSILFNVGSFQLGYPPNDINVEQWGILAISLESPTPKMVYESAKWVWISPDGMTLLSLRTDSEAQSTDVTFYDIGKGQSVNLVVPKVIENTSPEWLSDGNIQFEIITEQMEGVGETIEVFVLNSITQEIENFIQTISLPDFAFEKTGVLPRVNYGYISLDPSKQLAVYTTLLGDNRSLKIRLRNLETGEVLWEYEPGSVSAALPEWSTDGSHVLLDVNSPNYEWVRLISLTRNGQEEELPPQPLPFADEYLINQYSRSPDGRYIFYLILSSDWTFAQKNEQKPKWVKS